MSDVCPVVNGCAVHEATQATAGLHEVQFRLRPEASWGQGSCLRGRAAVNGQGQLFAGQGRAAVCGAGQLFARQGS